MTRQKQQFRGELNRRNIVNLYYYCLFVKCQDLFNSALYSPLYDCLSLQVTDDWAVTYMDSLLHMVYFKPNEVFDEIIHYGTNVRPPAV